METKVLIFIIFLIPSICFSQEIQFMAWNGSAYDTTRTFPPNGVADDFGPRRVSDNWHGGVDFNSSQDDGDNDKWDLIVAPEDGEIVDVNRLWTTLFNYKQLCYQAGDHRYVFGHVYDNSSSSYIRNDSTIILKNMLGENNDKWAQILIVGTDTIVYGQVVGLVEWNGDTLSTTNVVTAGNPLVPLGNAGINGAHLHLNTIPLDKDYSTGSTTWNSNPLQYINYEGADYTLSLYSENYSNTVVPIYPGDAVTPMALKVEMHTTVSGQGNKRYDHIFDLNDVKFFLKEISSFDFDTIRGPYIGSHINYGGLLGENILNHPNPNFGNWVTTGVDSRAYNSGYPNQPYDIFHYSDFVTRIHRDDPMDGTATPTMIADCPQNARYNDGRYELKAVVTDVQGNTTEGPKDANNNLAPIEFTLDNFQPFIQHVTADIAGHTIYDRAWECMETCVQLANSLPDPECPYTSLLWPGTITVNVVSSEPLEHLLLNVPELNITGLAPVTTPDNGLNWQYVVPFGASQLLKFDKIRFEFQGADMSDNELMNLFFPGPGTPCVELPVRMANGWSSNETPTGTDLTHYFYINCGQHKPGNKNSNETTLTIIPEADCVDVTWTVTPASGPSAADGSITLDMPTGGVAPYTYLWPNGETTNSISGLLPGEYCVLVSDAYCCQREFCIFVDYNCELTIQSLTPLCICPGGYGSAEVEVSGGSGNYAYAWKTAPGNGISNPTVANPLIYDPGSYTVLVTDSETGCEVSGTVEVQVCNIDLSSLLTVQPDCNEVGTSTLSIQLPAGYGLPPYEFKWIRPGLGVVEVDASEDGYADLKNATAGEYCLSVLTQNGCSEQICGIVVETQPAPQIDYSVAPVVNENDGAIILNVTGQPGPFTYQWDSGQTTPSISGLSSGTYCVTVTDQGSACTATACIDLTDCETLGLMIDPLKANVTAITSANGIQTGGAIDIINVLDQFPGYDFNFQWSNGANTEDISGLEAGIYSVSVTLDECVLISQSFSWEICDAALKFNQVNLDCYTAKLEVVPSVEGNHSYQWSTGETTTYVVGPIGQTYCVTVSLEGGCEAMACHSTEMKELEINLLQMQNASAGNANGLIEVSGKGGVPPYNYYWSNGSTGPIISGLSPGTYSVTMTDDCGQVTYGSWYLQCEFGQEDVSGTVEDVECSTNSTGSITLTQLPMAGSGNTSWHFNWSNGATTQNISGLVAGNYCVTITELNSGCLAQKCFNVGAGGEASYTVQLDLMPSCYPLAEGSITANTSSQATAPFTYAWGSWFWGPSSQSLGNGQTISNLPAGYYFVTVTDQLGCTATSSAFLQPAPPSFSVSVSTEPSLVCGNETAIATASINGGTAPYTFEWANYSEYPAVVISGTSPQVPGLSAGNWAVTVTDATGCQNVATFSIQHSDIKLRSVINEFCRITASVSLSPYGGIAPYSYQWSTGAVTSSVKDLATGTYTVTVTDAAGCSIVASYSVNPSPPPGIDLQITHAPAYEPGGTGSIEAQVSGGQSPYSYLWNTGYQGPVLIAAAGTYSVTVTDINGCTATATGTIQNISDLNISSDPTVDIRSCVLGNGSININVFGACSPFSYQWSGPPGFAPTTTEDINHITISGTYCVTVTDNCGQQAVRCFLMDCECPASDAPRFVVFNQCLEVLGDDGTADIQLDKLPFISYPPGEDKYYLKFYKTGFVTELIGEGVVSGFGSDITVLSGVKKVEVGAGHFLVNVQTPGNCIYTYTYTFTGPQDCQNLVSNFNLSLGESYNNYDLNQWGPVIHRCGAVDEKICGSYNTPHGSGLLYKEWNTPYTDVLDYFPCDPQNPCNSGGYLKCPSQCGPAHLIPVPANIGGFPVQITDDKCGCIFPTGMIPEFQDEPYQVFGEYNCNNPTPAGDNFLCPGEVPTSDVPDPPVECPVECAHCEAQTNEIQCTTDYFCIDELGQPTGEVIQSFQNFSLCAERVYNHATNEVEYDIYEYCTIQECNSMFYLGSMGIDDVVILIDSWFIDWLEDLTGYENVEDMVDENFVDESTVPTHDPSNPSQPGPPLLPKNHLTVLDLGPCPCALQPLTGGEDQNIDQTEALRIPDTGNTLDISGNSSSKVFPNPFSGTFTLRIVSPQQRSFRLELFNVMGERIWGSVATCEHGVNDFVLDPEAKGPLENGIYLLSLTDDTGERTTHRIIKLQ